VRVSGREYYYLPVSHAVEKQLSLEHAERVYCLAPCVRLLMEGEDRSGRHLYTFFQFEIEWRTEDVDEVHSLIESILALFARELLARVLGTALVDEATRRRIEAFAETPYERIRFGEARARVKDVGGEVNPHGAADLTHAEERALSEAASAPLWLTEYPEGVRDSLYRRRGNGTFATYDLILPGGHGELATGGLRPDSGEDVVAQARALGAPPNEFYAEWKARTGVQTGGLGFGVERLVRYCAGVPSVLDLRPAHDHGPNARIGR
jgi:asparaginyl-tRNA synthetase